MDMMVSRTKGNVVPILGVKLDTAHVGLAGDGGDRLGLLCAPYFHCRSEGCDANKGLAAKDPSKFSQSCALKRPLTFEVVRARGEAGRVLAAGVDAPDALLVLLKRRRAAPCARIPHLHNAVVVYAEEGRG